MTANPNADGRFRPSAALSMTWLQLILAASLLLLGGVAVLLQLASLPGTWIILLVVVATHLFETFVPIGSETIFGWGSIGTIAGLALVAELFEVGASAVGAKTGGASKRGMTGAIVGSLLGAIIGTFVLAFLPVIGSLLGALIGAAIGAIVGELSVGGKTLRETAKPAAGAVAGRLMGVVLKTVVAGVMLVVMAAAAFS
jgi:uncharacterized protein YqgC (DUF456 family)